MTAFRLSRPLHLLFAALTYSLGAAVADYLGITISVSTFALGLGWVLFVQGGMNLLAAAFHPANEPIIADETRTGRVLLSDRLFLVSLGLLAIAAFYAYLLFLSGRVGPAAWMLFLISLFIVVGYAVPPLKLVRRGYGELLLAAHLGYVSLSLGFVLQSGGFHRLIPILALPLFALALACFIVFDFPAFAEDFKYERTSLLSLVGWQRAIPLHHALVLAAFGLLAAAPLAGLSYSVLWPAFLSLPFAILQILLLRNIGLGAPPLWRLLTFNAATLFALTAYLLASSFFIR